MFRILLVPFLLMGLTKTTRAHELPDGELERRVQIVVKPNVVLVEYSLAMNEATLDKELHRLGEKPNGELSEKWDQYRKMILPQLPKHMGVIVDGESVPLHAVRADYRGWSHVHLTFLLKAEIHTNRERTSILVTDANFVETPGHYRIAMKGRSGTTIENSTVPPMLSRAKPVLLSELARPKREAASRAKGQIVLSKFESAGHRQ